MFALSLLLLCAVGSLASPATRVRRQAFNLAGGLPLDLLFASCDADESGDIGPCLAQLLGGAIDAARPEFASPGVKIGRKRQILEPLTLDDIEPKPNKDFKVGVTDLEIHGISSVAVEAIRFDTERLALNLTFDRITATGEVGLKYLFIKAQPEVQINFDQLSISISADWEVVQSEVGKLDLSLSNAVSHFQLEGISFNIDGLGGLGVFLEKLLNKNKEVLRSFLIPELEKNVNKKLNKKLNKVKLVD